MERTVELASNSILKVALAEEGLERIRTTAGFGLLSSFSRNSKLYKYVNKDQKRAKKDRALDLRLEAILPKGFISEIRSR